MKLIIDIEPRYCKNIHSEVKELYYEAINRITEAVSNGIPYEERPQGEYVDISKLRLMTVEECAGHTIDYAMGWKACVEWIKKGGAEWDKKQH